MKITVNEVGYILDAAKVAVSDHKSEFRIIDILKEESVPCQIRIKECGMLPTVVMKSGHPVATVQDGDSVIFFNFRPDRAREMTHCFCDDNFDKFARGPRKDITFVTFTDYDPLIINKQVAFKKVLLTNTFGEWLAAKGKKQARIAETEKYAHDCK